MGALNTIAPERREQMADAGLRTFLNIAKAWKLSEGDAAMLLGTSASTYRRWRQKNRADLDVNQLERLSLILGIYKALQILLPREDAADSWVNRPNRHPLFGGKPPIERLKGGQVGDLIVVRNYLDAERGW
ncbi:MAG: MbcA/ParS/Xre antitoxin family protein [Arhodomonas sp.]|nr:MbcA/ParS/Xre antitoxin family protein [Arhodomonas sp.]